MLKKDQKMNNFFFVIVLCLLIKSAYPDKLSEIFCEQENPSFAFSKTNISTDGNSYWKIECGCNCTGDFFSTIYMRWNKGEMPVILLSVSDIRSCSAIKTVTNHLNDLVLYTLEDDENDVPRTPVFDTLVFNSKNYIPKNLLKNVTLVEFDTVALTVKIMKNLSNVSPVSSNQQAYEKALALFKSGKKLESARILQEAIGPKPWAIDDNNVAKFNDLGYFLQEAGQNQDAVDVLTEVIAKFPERIPAYLNLADAYAGIKNSNKAKENYKKYAELMTKAGKQGKIPKRVVELLKK